MTVSPIGGSMVVAFNPTLANAVQDRTLQRTYLDALYPRLLYGADAAPELWQGNLGTTTTFTRSGLIKASTRPIAPGADPKPRSYEIEQWEATAAQYGNAIDTHMPTSAVSLASTYLRNMHVLGLNAGQSKNRLVRDKVFNAYLAGTTHVRTSTGPAASITVRNLNGFTRKLLNGRPAAVSASNPLDITIVISGTATAAQVIGFTPVTTGDELGPGTLTLAASVTVTAGDPVFASNRSQPINSGGATTIDGIGLTDRLTLSDIRAGIAQLRANNVPPHEDGKYHVHLDPISESQLFDDPEFRQAYQGVPDYVAFREFALAELGGSVFYRNNESPLISTVDTDPETGATFAMPTENTPSVGSAIEVHRVLITGAGHVEEKYLDESRYISEAGVMGKIGEFAVVNNGMQVMAERIRLILRAPTDRLQQQVSAAWSWSGDFAVPTDAKSATSLAIKSDYRRAVVIQHA